MRQCVEAGDRCALSQVSATATELETTLWHLAEELRISPITVNTTIIDYNFILNLYYISIKESYIFQQVAQVISNILNRQDLEAVVELSQSMIGSLALGNPDAIYGILGSDKFPRYAQIEGVMPDIKYMAQTSTRFWGLTAASATIVAQWPFVAKERYGGDFHVKTKNPILFVGNTWDPSTPAASARNMSAAFAGSVMFEQHSVGVSNRTSNPPIVIFGKSPSQTFHIHSASLRPRHTLTPHMYSTVPWHRHPAAHPGSLAITSQRVLYHQPTLYAK